MVSVVAVLVSVGVCGIGNSPKFGGNLCSSEMLRSRLKLSHVPLSLAGQPSGQCEGGGGLWGGARGDGESFTKKVEYVEEGSKLR